MLSFSRQLAEASRPIVHCYFRQETGVELKKDASPVSFADKEVEAFLREAIAKSYPDHAILGEEQGQTKGTSEYCWVIDPIDGTRAFLAGVPVFTTLIAVARVGKPVCSVISQPVSGELWLAETGGVTEYIDPEGKVSEVSARGTTRLEKAVLSTTSPHYFRADKQARFERLRGAVRDCVYGYDAYAYAMLAHGQLDLVVEDGLKPYDFMALAPVVEAAGGIITDWQGHPLTLESSGDVLAACSRSLHHAALGILRQS